MKLSRQEMETIITYNAEENTANFYTANQSDIRKIQKLIDAGEDVKVLRQSANFLEAEVPKKWVKVKPPRKMSDEAKKAAGERMRAWRQQKGGGSG